MKILFYGWENNIKFTNQENYFFFPFLQEILLQKCNIFLSFRNLDNNLFEIVFNKDIPEKREHIQIDSIWREMYFSACEDLKPYFITDNDSEKNIINDDSEKNIINDDSEKNIINDDSEKNIINDDSEKNIIYDNSHKSPRKREITNWGKDNDMSDTEDEEQFDSEDDDNHSKTENCNENIISEKLLINTEKNKLDDYDYVVILEEEFHFVKHGILTKKIKTNYTITKIESFSVEIETKKITKPTIKITFEYFENEEQVFVLCGEIFEKN
jgi:hypothetical protein